MLYTIDQLDLRMINTNNRLLKNISLHMEEGKVFCVVGETGSGKTMLLRAMTGLLPRGAVLSGRVAWKGETLDPLNREQMSAHRREHLGIVLQNASCALNPMLSLRQHLVMACGKKKLSLIRTQELLKKMGLQDPERLLGFRPFQLSGGMKQRFLIAMSLAGAPEVLILDEPTRGLDEKTKRELVREIRKLKEALGFSMLLITHDLALAEDLADHTAVLFEGEVVEWGTTKQVFSAPVHPYTKALFAALPCNGLEYRENIPGINEKKDEVYMPKGRPSSMIEIAPGHFVRCFSCCR